MRLKGFKTTGIAVAAMVGTTICAMTTAHAEEDRFTIHGFGNQDYAKSTANSFQNSGSAGTWDSNFLGLVMSATVNDKSKVWAQLQASSVEHARVTWMFVDYQFNDDLSVHIGRVKFPWGIYNEFVDTRALQQSISLPFAYSGEADFAYDAYNGVGVDYTLRTGSSGNVFIQGFLGNIYSPPPPTTNPPFPDQAGQANLLAVTVDHHVIGGKITWETPIEGLRLMVSGNQTRVASTADNGQIPNQNGNENRVLLSVDYVTDTLDVKAEYNIHKYPGLSGFVDQKSNDWYVQLALPMGAWTPYARYEKAVTDKNHVSDPSYYQRTGTLGVNRKINTNFNVRIEDAFNHGYALPVSAGETAIGTGKVNWQLYAVSVNFLF